MPASYVIYPEWNLKYVHVTSSIELEELRLLAAEYFDDPQFDLSLSFLVDLRDLVASSARFRDVFALYSYYRRKLAGATKPIEVAIVAPDDFAFGMAHMFFSLTNMGNVMRVKIFDDLAPATIWLGMPQATIEEFTISPGIKNSGPAG